MTFLGRHFSPGPDDARQAACGVRAGGVTIANDDGPGWYAMLRRLEPTFFEAVGIGESPELAAEELLRMLVDLHESAGGPACRDLARPLLGVCLRMLAAR